MNATDTEYSRSEYLGLASWRLGFQLDNITVHELEKTSSNVGMAFTWIVIPLIAMYIVLRRNKFN